METVKGIQPLKISIIAISQGPKSTSYIYIYIYIYISVKGGRNNILWFILDVIENRATPSTFTSSKSTIETIEQGVK